MKVFTQEELLEIIAKHGKWLRDKDGGERADLRSADLSYADLSYADLSSADLRYADLRSADLSYADLRSADLSSANLSSADLSYADLRSADLRSADLSYANLRSAKGQIFVAQRSDGYQFFAVYDGDNWMIRAGCQYKTVEEYRVHTASYCDAKKTSETLLIMDFAEAMIKDRGIIE